MTKAFLVIHSGGNLSKSQVKEQALKELKARYDEYREPCICVVFDKDNKGIYLGIANEGGAKIEGFPLFMDIQTLDINRAEQSSTGSEASTAVSEQSDTASVPANSLAIDTSNFALKSELDEFDTQAYKEGINAFIAEAKKEVVTLGQLDEFDTQAYKSELNAIADEVKNKMAVFDGLSELDLSELKAEIKAQIKAELKAEILAELRG
ncbi:hypothetical protein [Campylobacter sp.]|uniref:hypothetical protein n=1 Tax=Campylobacter sp. TaxID=205 RepID=UPI002AA6B2E9|nr:hypothetical protein [Campylobacter sp.]MCI7581919.1 hypothetical protein [Campylobacter sp.]